jgi:hypothetical protein
MNREERVERQRALLRTAQLQHIEQRLRSAGIIAAKAVYVPPDDPSVDGEIQIKVAGVELATASVVLQICEDGSYCVNRCLYVEGQLDAIEHLYVGNGFLEAVDRLVSALALITPGRAA